MAGATGKLKRALVSLMLSLVRAYGCAVAVDRGSSEQEVGRAYRQLSRYVHPDKESMAAYTVKIIELWTIPARSPDLNPIQEFFGWLRRELRRRDLKDLQEKRPVLSRTAFKARVRAVLRAKKTQRVAGRIASGLFSVCKEVKAKRGAASRS